VQAGDLPVSTTVAAIVLGVVLLVGIFAGRAKARWTLLVAGLAAVLVLAIAVTAATGGPAGDASAAEITALYQLALPLGVAFAAGWLCARGSWLRRLLVLGVAALLLASFPYVAAGQATADTLLGSSEVNP
jgi:peptidoglycan/LPS O-acetylase OafA/YrhL